MNCSPFIATWFNCGFVFGCENPIVFYALRRYFVGGVYHLQEDTIKKATLNLQIQSANSNEPESHILTHAQSGGISGCAFCFEPGNFEIRPEVRKQIFANEAEYDLLISKTSPRSWCDIAEQLSAASRLPDTGDRNGDRLAILHSDYCFAAQNQEFTPVLDSHPERVVDEKRLTEHPLPERAELKQAPIAGFNIICADGRRNFQRC